MPSDPDEAPAGARLVAPLRRSAARAARCAAIAALLASSACQPAVLDPAGPVGQAQKQILIGSVAIMLAIVVPTITATLLFAWWFRAGNARARRRLDFAYSGRIEMVTWSVPLLTITLLSGVAWIGSHRLDPGQPLEGEAPLDVQVVSMDWRWLFIYPEQRIASVNRLVIPAGQPIRFSLTSASVMNAFFVPQLGSMIYTMNGMRTQLHLQADHPGTFRGLSTHLSGDGFSDMRFEVEALPAEGFAGWVEGTRSAAGPALDAGSYAELVRQSMDTRAFTFREADPGLFGRIVTQELPPGPGPQIGQPHPAVSPRAEH